MENMILKHMDVVRGITTSILEKTTEEADGHHTKRIQ